MRKIIQNFITKIKRNSKDLTPQEISPIECNNCYGECCSECGQDLTEQLINNIRNRSDRLVKLSPNFNEVLKKCEIKEKNDLDDLNTEGNEDFSFQNQEKRGSFIVIDGPDGSGKSTVISILKEYINELIITRDPGGTKEGMEIRKMILDDKYDLDKFSIALMFLVSRYETQEKIIKPAIDNNKVVISDRWDSSTFSYQGTEGLQKEVNLLNYKFIKPDYFIHLDIDPEKSLDRSYEKARSLNVNNELRFENKGVEFHSKIRERMFLYKNTYFTDNNSITIDTSMMTPHQVCGKILMFMCKKGLIS